jgi:hypothetical protein
VIEAAVRIAMKEFGMDPGATTASFSHAQPEELGLLKPVPHHATPPLTTPQLTQAGATPRHNPAHHTALMIASDEES